MRREFPLSRIRHGPKYISSEGGSIVPSNTRGPNIYIITPSLPCDVANMLQQPYFCWFQICTKVKRDLPRLSDALRFVIFLKARAEFRNEIGRLKVLFLATFRQPCVEPKRMLSGAS